ncbi:MAG: 4-(cytidine 5'-diphospho)-2-C-methyl-D-erythritol kinase [Muribaculaceae bacterium]|nr:4-(cytidine 5'-diphospho)-2-C-methyl-D-erythritol kinase [Muribaculaceae bacterium]
MILFPNCKINIGLRILGKRADGYHDVLTAMIPVGWSDVLELVPAAGRQSSLTCTGHSLATCPPEKNLVMKALRAVENYTGRELPTDIYLRKIIPDGAGLGGGSADAAFTIRGLNELYGLQLDDESMASIASEIGSDCPFFLFNRPMLATGRGTELRNIDVCMDGIGAIVVAKGETEAVSTREAYAGVAPRPLTPEEDLCRILQENPAHWSGRIVNDFEPSIFALRPTVKELKAKMLEAGAVYASMSGSGAAVYGLFPTLQQAEQAAKTLTATAQISIHVSPINEIYETQFMSH